VTANDRLAGLDLQSPSAGKPRNRGCGSAAPSPVLRLAEQRISQGTFSEEIGHFPGQSLARQPSAAA
jgi:hypothetical protein